MHDIGELHEAQENILAGMLKQPLPEEGEKRTYLENLKKSEVNACFYVCLDCGYVYKTCVKTCLKFLLV